MMPHASGLNEHKRVARQCVEKQVSSHYLPEVFCYWSSQGRTYWQNWGWQARADWQVYNTWWWEGSHVTALVTISLMLGIFAWSLIAN
jgi:hypothetical protein